METIIIKLQTTCLRFELNINHKNLSIEQNNIK